MASENKIRIDHISQMIFEIARGNFDYEMNRTEKEDELDAIVVGINMLREELKSTTVSRDYMDNLFEGVVDMIFVLDGNFNILKVNDAVEELFRAEEGSLVGCHFADLVEKKSRVSLEAIRRVLGNARPLKDIELHLKTEKLDESTPASCSFSIMYDTWKQESSILIIAKDISRQKQIEQELRSAKENAEAASLAKSRFLANMSHEIRTPLNGILGIAEILSLEIKDPEHLKYIAMIRSSGKNLTGLINDILDLSKIESGKLDIERVEFPFADTILSNLQSYRYLAEQKGLAFHCTVDNQMPHRVVGDPTRLNQVVINLVSNAIKFTEAGSVNIRFSMIQKQNNRITIQGEVQDTGPGIADGKENLIFQSFTQADDSVARKFGGTGLGLAIVKNLVQQMGGEIKVTKPESGTGSIFTFSMSLDLPEERPQEISAKEETRELPIRSSGVKILVVDDNEVNLLITRTLLQKFGFNVSISDSGIGAVELVKKNTFDLIFMDIQMPEMDGYETTREIRRINFTNPIIALSANVFDEHIRQSYEAGMNDHLQKPFNSQEILDIIRKHLEMNQDKVKAA